ncbi:hypothetical protein CsSME_00042501 [Camellia sinensis var. sinensis]
MNHLRAPGLKIPLSLQGLLWPLPWILVQCAFVIYIMMELLALWVLKECSVVRGCSGAVKALKFKKERKEKKGIRITPRIP